MFYRNQFTFNFSNVLDKHKKTKASHVTLRIYNILGQEVKTLVNSQQSAGTHEVRWDGTDKHGITVSTGVYLYRLESNSGYAKTRKLLFIK